VHLHAEPMSPISPIRQSAAPSNSNRPSSGQLAARRSTSLESPTCRPAECRSFTATDSHRSECTCSLFVVRRSWVLSVASRQSHAARLCSALCSLLSSTAAGPSGSSFSHPFSHSFTLSLSISHYFLNGTTLRFSCSSSHLLICSSTHLLSHWDTIFSVHSAFN